MTVSERISLVQTRDISEFVQLMKELIELSDRFKLSMLCWCGIGEQKEPLVFRQIYVAKLNAEPLGVMGLYQLTGMLAETVWVDWFGVRPKFRHQGFGTKMMNELKQLARNLKFKELWVFVDCDNKVALKFYTNAGFIQLGKMIDIYPGESYELSDIIFKFDLSNY